MRLSPIYSMDYDKRAIDRTANPEVRAGFGTSHGSQLGMHNYRQDWQDGVPVKLWKQLKVCDGCNLRRSNKEFGGNELCAKCRLTR